MSDPNQKSSRPCGVLSTLIVCAAAVVIVYLFVGQKHEQKLRRLWTPMIIETNGTQNILGDTLRMEFWTPSARTKDFLSEKGAPIPPKETWEAIADDDVVLKFGTLLHSNKNVLGYRRVEVWGHGRTSFKPGWWWTVNVTTNCPVSQLSKAYQDFWKPPTAVLIEVIDNRGSEE